MGNHVSIDDQAIRAAVRHHYASAVNEVSKEQPKGESGCCTPTCCGETAPSSSLKLGYSPEDLSRAPGGADLGLGCGNPQAIAF